MNRNTIRRTGKAGRCVLASLAFIVLVLVAISCKMLEVRQDCTPSNYQETSQCALVFGNDTILRGGTGRYYPDTSLSSVEYSTIGLAEDDDRLFYNRLVIGPRFIVVHSVLFVDTIKHDRGQSIATGVSGASVYCLDTSSAEFRVFNYTIDTNTLRFVELKRLSFRLKSIRTKAWKYMAENVLPLYGHHPKGFVFVHHTENTRYVPTTEPFEYSSDGDDDGYRQALEDYELTPNPK